MKLSATELRERAEILNELASPCRLCPRECHARRAGGEYGSCQIGLIPRIASFGPHFGEEEVLVGQHGSGTIFFSGCNLHCVFCQNYQISQLGEGQEISIEKLAESMLRLQELGCHNLNLVTPTHQAPQIVQALAIACESGLQLPIVWNCGGYESVEVLQLLSGIVDIYMPDMKYGDSQIAARYSSVSGYFKMARAALSEMQHQVGCLQIGDKVAQKGLLVRHLVLPENLAHTREVLCFIAEEVSTNTYINIMRQYHPAHKALDYPQLSRRITDNEYQEALTLARELGLRRVAHI